MPKLTKSEWDIWHLIEFVIIVILLIALGLTWAPPLQSEGTPEIKMSWFMSLWKNEWANVLNDMFVLLVTTVFGLVVWKATRTYRASQDITKSEQIKNIVENVGKDILAKSVTGALLQDVDIQADALAATYVREAGITAIHIPIQNGKIIPNAVRNVISYSKPVKAKEPIRFLCTMMEESDFFHDVLTEAKDSDRVIEIIMLHPSSAAARRRSLDLKNNDPSYVPDRIIQSVHRVQREAEARLVKLEIRLTWSMPPFYLCLSENAALIGFYYKSALATNRPMIQIHGYNTTLINLMQQEFLNTWTQAEKCTADDLKPIRRLRFEPLLNFLDKQVGREECCNVTTACPCPLKQAPTP